MRSFVVRIALFASIQGAIGAALLHNYWRVGNNYLLANLEKHERLVQAKRPRLVLIGGSNLAFGIDSAAIERELPYAPVNLGLSRSLSLRIMFAEAAAVLQAGDVLLVSPEYEVLWGHANEDTQTKFFMVRPDLVTQCDGRALHHLLDNAWSEFGHIAALGWDTLRGDPRARGGPMDDPVTPYDRYAFNAYGDHFAHWGRAPDRDWQYYRVQVRPDEASFDRAVAEIIHWRKMLEGRGVRVVLAAPPLPTTRYEEFKPNFDDAFARLGERTGVPVLLSPDEMVFEPLHFFDSDYHLRKAGTYLRTARLIAAVLRHR